MSIVLLQLFVETGIIQGVQDVQPCFNSHSPIHTGLVQNQKYKRSASCDKAFVRDSGAGYGNGLANDRNASVGGREVSGCGR